MNVKICCIKSITEAKLAISAGATALGLVGKMPSGPGVISDAEISHISAAIPDTIETFLLSSEVKAKQIIAHHRSVNTTALQLVDTVRIQDLKKVRSALENITLVQAVHISSAVKIDDVLEVQDYVDMILLDSGNPLAQVKELGGTGRTHNWDISRNIVQRCTKPVWLAGGLNASNVRQAIRQVHPYGVDLCSGVRTDDHLDKEKLEQFFTALHRLQ